MPVHPIDLAIVVAYLVGMMVVGYLLAGRINALFVALPASVVGYLAGAAFGRPR